MAEMDETRALNRDPEEFTETVSLPPYVTFTPDIMFNRRLTRHATINGGGLGESGGKYQKLEASSVPTIRYDNHGTTHEDIIEDLERINTIQSNIYYGGNIKAQKIQNPVKRGLYLLMEDASSSAESFVLNLVISIIIFIGSILSIIETIPQYHYLKYDYYWWLIEFFLMVVFSLEYTLRFYAHSDSYAQLWKFFRGLLALIDLMTFMPFFAELLFFSEKKLEFRFTVLRIFRLARVFRSFKYTSRFQLSIEVMLVAVRKSLDALSALFSFVLMTLIVFSTILYFAERGTWNEERQRYETSDGFPSDFGSIPAACWFVMATVTTTGYGDMYPRTWLGKAFTFPAMMCGILLIALPSVIIGRNFTVVWEAMKQYQRARLVQQVVPGCLNEDAIIGGELEPNVVPTSQAGAQDDNVEYPSLPETDDLKTLLIISRKNLLLLERAVKLLENVSNRPDALGKS